MVHAIITLAIACALFGIARQAFPLGEGFLLARLKKGSGYAQFINRDHFSYLMEMAFGLTVGVAFMHSGRPERIPLYLSGLVVISAALVLSLSRGGLLAMSIQTIFAGLLLGARVWTPRARVSEPRAVATGSSEFGLAISDFGLNDTTSALNQQSDIRDLQSLILHKYEVGQD